MAEKREWIVYLETDCTVVAHTANEAERFAQEFIKIESYSPLVKIDEHRRQKVVVSEKKKRETS